MHFLADITQTRLRRTFEPERYNTELYVRLLGLLYYVCAYAYSETPVAGETTKRADKIYRLPLA